jgi:hypothetical protein
MLLLSENFLKSQDRKSRIGGIAMGTNGERKKGHKI